MYECKYISSFQKKGSHLWAGSVFLPDVCMWSKALKRGKLQKVKPLLQSIEVQFSLEIGRVVGNGKTYDTKPAIMVPIGKWSQCFFPLHQDQTHMFSPDF